MTQLSPAAEAFLAAFRLSPSAALRVLADHVVPAARHPAQEQFDGFADWDRSSERWYQRKTTRRQIRAIARELEGRK